MTILFLCTFHAHSPNYGVLENFPTPQLPESGKLVKIFFSPPALWFELVKTLLFAQNADSAINMGIYRPQASPNYQTLYCSTYCSTLLNVSPQSAHL